MTEPVCVLLNARAGTLLDKGGSDPARLIEELFASAGRQADIQLCEPDRMSECLRRAAKHAPAIIVGGGDGTVAQAVQQLNGTEVALGILPLGTLNLLARDMGVPLDLGDAIQALGRTRITTIDLAELNGRPFHTLSGLGFFSEIARAREEVRGLNVPLGRYVAVAVSAVRALRRTRPMRLHLTIDGEEREEEAYALLVTNNAFDGAGWSRTALDRGKLEIHIAHEAGFAEMLKAGVDMLADAWRDNPGIESITASELTVARENRRRLWVATDGEIGREDAPLRYRILPGALKILAPAGPAPEAQSSSSQTMDT